MPPSEPVLVVFCVPVCDSDEIWLYSATKLMLLVSGWYKPTVVISLDLTKLAEAASPEARSRLDWPHERPAAVFVYANLS